MQAQHRFQPCSSSTPASAPGEAAFIAHLSLQRVIPISLHGRGKHWVADNQRRFRFLYVSTATPEPSLEAGLNSLWLLSVSRRERTSWWSLQGPLLAIRLTVITAKEREREKDYVRFLSFRQSLKIPAFNYRKHKWCGCLNWWPWQRFKKKQNRARKTQIYRPAACFLTAWRRKPACIHMFFQPQICHLFCSYIQGYFSQISPGKQEYNHNPLWYMPAALRQPELRACPFVCS